MESYLYMLHLLFTVSQFINVVINTCSGVLVNEIVLNYHLFIIENFKARCNGPKRNPAYNVYYTFGCNMSKNIKSIFIRSNDIVCK